MTRQSTGATPADTQYSRYLHASQRFFGANATTRPRVQDRPVRVRFSYHRLPHGPTPRQGRDHIIARRREPSVTKVLQTLPAASRGCNADRSVVCLDHVSHTQLPATVSVASCAERRLAWDGPTLRRERSAERRGLGAARKKQHCESWADLYGQAERCTITLRRGPGRTGAHQPVDV
jgi:hypothetical protein